MNYRSPAKLKQISCLLLSVLFTMPLQATTVISQPSVANNLGDNAINLSSDSGEKMTSEITQTTLNVNATAISSDIVSNAYNLKSMGGFSVDPRTGSLGVSFKVGSLWANGLQGGQVDLNVEYTGSNEFSAYPVAPSWSFSLPFVDMKTATFLLPGGGRYRMLSGNKLQYAKLQGTQFAFQQNKDASYSFTDASGTVSSFNQQGYLWGGENPQ